MRLRRPACLVALPIAFLLTAPAAAPTARPAGLCRSGGDWPAAQPELGRDVVSLVNAHRKRLHLPTLTVSATLTRAAAWKAAHMARYHYLRHDDPAPPVKRTVGARLAACGYPISWAAWGENIAFGYETPAAVMDAWLHSRRHRRNIEYRRFSAIGVAAARGENGLVYWAEDLGSYRGSSADGSRGGGRNPSPPSPPPAP